MVAYWSFDGNANDQTGNYNAPTAGIIGITYVTGRNAASGQAASFNGTTSLIEIPNGDVLENSADFSLSFWMKMTPLRSEINLSWDCPHGLVSSLSTIA